MSECPACAREERMNEERMHEGSAEGKREWAGKAGKP